jgi:formylglycine-generating enzyme required for sulfatase activity
VKWVSIPGGTFEMGCSPGDGDCSDDEKPPHSVTVSGFEMLETEVTEAQYETVMGDNPSCDYNGGGGPDNPVECVTWFDAKAFCEGIGGRLPTEAEWEYSARGGTTTRYSCGDDASCLDAIAWYDANSDGHKHDVKGKDPNGYGLYDMSGNVWEWTADWYSETYYSESPANNPQGPDSGSIRVFRGGGFDYYAVYLRVSFRGYFSPSGDYSNLGLRCARSE